MNKTILMISVCIVIVFSIISLAVVLLSSDKSSGENSKKGNVSLEDAIVKQKETALKIGIALLEEYCPDAFLDPDIVFSAEEKDGIWRVNNVFAREGITEDGKVWTIEGGEIYVEFRKDNGRVIKIGVDD